MTKRMLLHDLTPEQVAETLGNLPDDIIECAADPTTQPCIGCFDCWMKTPGSCIFNDKNQATPAMLAASDELIIISRNLYGGFSSDVKATLDRSIGYIMPFFRIIRKEMHHTMRYDNPFLLSVHFYGDRMTEADKEIARDLIPSIALNLGAAENHVEFHESPSALKGVLA